METLKFKAGDLVAWLSQSNGSQTEKHGEVVQVVPKGVTPHSMIANAKSQGWNTSPVDGGGMMRDHESYLVRVQIGKRKPMLYWPRVKALFSDGAK